MVFEHWLELGLIVLPLAGAIVVAVLGPQRGGAVRSISSGIAVACAVLAFALAWSFISLERSASLSPHEKKTAAQSVAFTPYFVPGSTEKAPHSTTWEILPVGKGAVQFFIGVDGLNIWLVVLTAVLILPCVLVSWTHVSERVNEFYAWLLVLQTCLFGVFLAFDIILFYVFFELSLIPLFFLIGIWGGPERRYAARKFFVYTLGGSLLTFLGVIAAVVVCQNQEQVLTFSIPRLVEIVQTQLAAP